MMFFQQVGDKPKVADVSFDEVEPIILIQGDEICPAASVGETVEDDELFDIRPGKKLAGQG